MTAMIMGTYQTGTVLDSPSGMRCTHQNLLCHLYASLTLPLLVESTRMSLRSNQVGFV